MRSAALRRRTDVTTADGDDVCSLWHGRGPPEAFLRATCAASGMCARPSGGGGAPTEGGYPWRAGWAWRATPALCRGFTNVHAPRPLLSSPHPHRAARHRLPPPLYVGTRWCRFSRSRCSSNSNVRHATAAAARPGPLLPRCSSPPPNPTHPPSTHTPTSRTHPTRPPHPDPRPAHPPSTPLVLQAWRTYISY